MGSNMNARIRHKRDTSTNWTTANPVLLDGEIIIVDTENGIRTKTGDGIKRYLQLPFDDEVVRNLISAKLSIAQGSNHSGKILSIGTNGNVGLRSLSCTNGITATSTTDNQITISHDNSGVSADTYGASQNKSLLFGDTYSVPAFTVNAGGHITDAATYTFTLPSNTATSSTPGLLSTEDKIELDRVASEIDNKLSKNGGTVSGSLNITKSVITTDLASDNLFLNGADTSGDAGVTITVESLVKDTNDDIVAQTISLRGAFGDEPARLSGVYTPAFGDDAANKQYVDNLVDSKHVTIKGTCSDGTTINFTNIPTGKTPWEYINELVQSGITPDLEVTNYLWTTILKLCRYDEYYFSFTNYEVTDTDGLHLLQLVQIAAGATTGTYSCLTLELDSYLERSGGTLTGALTLKNKLILDSTSYGASLPPTGVAGQVFFKKV